MVLWRFPSCRGGSAIVQRDCSRSMNRQLKSNLSGECDSLQATASVLCSIFHPLRGLHLLTSFEMVRQSNNLSINDNWVMWHSCRKPQMGFNSPCIETDWKLLLVLHWEDRRERWHLLCLLYLVVSHLLQCDIYTDTATRESYLVEVISLDLQIYYWNVEHLNWRRGWMFPLNGVSGTDDEK